MKPTRRQIRPGEPFNPYGWGDGIWVPNWLYRRTEVSADAKLLYARLVRFTARGGECRPSQDYLARDMNRSLRTIQRHLAELEEHGLLRRVRRGAMRSNIYEFLWHDWMEDDGTWYPHGDLATGEPQPLADDEPPSLAGYYPPRLAAPLPYEQERGTKRNRSRLRERNFGAARPEANLPEDEPLARRSPEPRANSGAGLARFFRRTAEESFSRKELGPSPFNDAALAKTFVAWMKEDEVSAAEIREMITAFCAGPLPAGKTPWVGFVGSRARLLSDAQRHAQDNIPAAERYAL